ncbi:MAG: hypothetical protein WBC93_09620 [Sulfitobacter sp.]
MGNLIVTKTAVRLGRWEGIVTGTGADMPALDVTHQTQPVADVRLVRDENQGHWVLHIPIPIEAISDGVQAILINDKDTGEKLNSFSIIAGEALGDDMRVEINLLRAELDMLKRAFRRHCVETA